MYRDFAEKLKPRHSAMASILQSMCEEETAHHARLLERYKLEYGDHIPLVRRHLLFPNPLLLDNSAWRE